MSEIADTSRYKTVYNLKVASYRNTRACTFAKGGGEMPELLEGLEQLAREHSDTLQRASRELTGEPEGFLIVTREVCKYVDFLCDFWDVIEMRLRNGGISAKRLVQQCDRLLSMGEVPAHYLALVIKVWRERSLPSPMAQPTYDYVRLSQERLNALLAKARKAREWAATPPRISADPEKIKQRISQADEKGEWVRIADAVSRMRQGGPPKEE